MKNIKNKFLTSLITGVLALGLSNVSFAEEETMENPSFSPEYSEPVQQETIADKTETAVNKRVPNAYEQGYGNIKTPEQIQQENAYKAQMQGARQQGMKQTVDNGKSQAVYYTDKNSYNKIARQLRAKGVSSKRIQFEGQRLDKQEFADWASSY